MGYHLTAITKGKLGTLSKIQEELDELKDAEVQGTRILILCEIADIVGAVQHYLDSEFPGFTVYDALAMAMLTQSAFKDGER